MRRTGLFVLLTILMAIVAPAPVAAADLEPKTETDWSVYVAQTEKRIDSELKGSGGFLIRSLKKPADAAKILARLKKNEVVVEKMETKDAKNKAIDIDGGIVHHWYGAIFIPEMTVQRLLRWVQNYNDHHKYFKEVEKSELKKASPDRSTFNIQLQLVRTKVVTVHYETEHFVTFRQIAPGKVSSASISTRIQEIQNAGKPSQKLLPVGHDSGYFWHTNSYWRYEEADGGVYVECESLSLSRTIPFGLGFVVGHFTNSIPSESLEAMLTSIRDGSKSVAR